MHNLDLCFLCIPEHEHHCNWHLASWIPLSLVELEFPAAHISKFLFHVHIPGTRITCLAVEYNGMLKVWRWSNVSLFIFFSYIYSYVKYYSLASKVAMFIYDTSSYVARQRAPYDSNCHLLRLEEMPLKMPIFIMRKTWRCRRHGEFFV